MMKGSWIEIRAGRDHSPVTVMGKTDSTWGNQFIANQKVSVG